MAKGKKDDLKTVTAEPLDSIDDSKLERKETPVSGDNETTETTETTDTAKESTTSERVSEINSKSSKDNSEKEAPIEEVPLDDDKSGTAVKDSKSKDKDDDAAATTIKASSTKSQSQSQSTESGDSVPPPPPPKRPKDPVEQIVQDLKDAFPQSDDKIITAVLIASQGNPEPAFGALLYLSDPTFKPDIPVYPQHQPTANPRAAFGSGIVRSRAPSDTSHTFTDDEILARKLQKEFELEDERQRRRREEKARQRQFHGERGSRGAGGSAGSRSSRERVRPRRSGDGDEDDFDQSPDEFETIKETFTQGLEEARTTINGWVSGLAKKFDNASANKGGARYDRANDDDYDYDYAHDDRRYESRGGAAAGAGAGRQQFGSKSHRDGGNNFGNLGGGRYYDDWRHKNNRTRFDEDPQIITGDFQDQITITDRDDGSKGEVEGGNKNKSNSSRSRGGAGGVSKDGKDAKSEDDPETTPTLPRRPRMSSDVADDSRKEHVSGAASNEKKTIGGARAGAATTAATTDNAFSVDDSDDDDEGSNLVKSK
ncbi:CUE5 [Candida theae]|uniref:CUE5 n=1 Tax=Candida theae TaxID=1198502 RepID=A0AAD5FXN9_9ASCO|nr:CUE5 [Candida theae]KAI5954797.1 CUE5 [Candida theae]